MHYDHVQLQASPMQTALCGPSITSITVPHTSALPACFGLPTITSRQRGGAQIGGRIGSPPLSPPDIFCVLFPSLASAFPGGVWREGRGPRQAAGRAVMAAVSASMEDLSSRLDSSGITDHAAKASTSAAATPARKRTVEDFTFGRMLGEGSYSTVRRAQQGAR